jgi:glycosyltransferase involved in cell wall biosynthesis
VAQSAKVKLLTRPWPILLLVRKLDHGGCERDLSKIALGLDRSMFEPHVGCFLPEGIRVAELREAGIPIVHLPVTSFKSPSAIRGAMILRRYMRQHRIELVHAFDVPLSLFAGLLARWCGARAVITAQLAYRGLSSPMDRRLLRMVDRMADRVVVNCEAMSRHMVEDEGLRPERAYLCYNGVDTAVFHPGPGERPEPLRDATLIIGTIANLRPEKGLHLLLEAFAAVRRPGMKLLIVGSGPSLEELQARSRELAIADDCLFLPGKPQIASEMRAIDVFVLPSLSEAFSNALLEAMASGCAVIGSNLGGTPELIRDGKTGLLFRPGDSQDLAEKLRYLIEHDDLRRKFGCEAASFTHATFPISRTVSRMTDLYQSLLESL